MSYWHQRRYDDAIVWAKRALELDSKQLLAGEFLAGAYWVKGNLDAFSAENLWRAEVTGVPPETLGLIRSSCAEMKTAYENGGHTALNRYMLQRIPPMQDSAAAIRLAILCGAVGDLDAAFTHLDRAIEWRDPGLVHLAVDPQWDSLRADLRFPPRLARMGFARATEK